METPLYIKTKAIELTYTCPHCKETTQYDTSSLPTKEECHKCLKPISWKVIYIDHDR